LAKTRQLTTKPKGARESAYLHQVNLNITAATAITTTTNYYAKISEISLGQAEL